MLKSMLRLLHVNHRLNSCTKFRRWPNVGKLPGN